MKLIGFVLIGIFAASIVGMTIASAGWKGAAIIWGGSIALVGIFSLGMYLVERG